MDIPEYAEMVKDRYNNVVSDILQNMIDNFDDYVESIAESLVLNDALWYMDYEDITNDNIDYFKSFLIAKKQYLDAYFA